MQNGFMTTAFWRSLLGVHFSGAVHALSKRSYAQKIRPLPQIDESEIEETFVRGSGPGGKLPLEI